MTALFTVPVTPRRNLMIAVTLLAVAAGANRMRAPRDAEPERPAITEETATITEVRDSFGCGTLVGVGQVRYGDRFGAVVPCIELARLNGLRFAVGDTQTLYVDATSRIVAIRWRGKTWQFDHAYEVVKTPADAIGPMAWSAGEHMAYRSGHWSWHWDFTTN